MSQQQQKKYSTTATGKPSSQQQQQQQRLGGNDSTNCSPTAINLQRKLAFDKNTNNNNEVDFLDSEEPNNNSLFHQSEPHLASAAVTIRMDSRRKQNNDTPTSKNGGGSSSATPGSAVTMESVISKADEGPSAPNFVPSYSSIFTAATAAAATNNNNQSYSNRTSQQHQQAQKKVIPSLKRGPLRKQSANDDGTPELGKRSVFATHKCTNLDSDFNDEHDDDDDEQESEGLDQDDDSHDERFPFRARNEKRISSETHKQPNNKKQQRSLNGSKSDLGHYIRSSRANTKISFSDSRPPSFNTCQAINHNKKLNQWQQYEPTTCNVCNCHNCQKKRKLAMINGHPLDDLEAIKLYPRTKAMHLVLKSIILILCTLLLFMLLVGVIIASHYLPQAFDRILNVSRSFNVTIAG